MTLAESIRRTPIFDICTLVFGIALGIANFVVYYEFRADEREVCASLSTYIVFVAYTSIILTGVLILVLAIDMAFCGVGSLCKDEVERTEEGSRFNPLLHLVHFITLATLLTGLAYSGVAARDWYGTDGTHEDCRWQLRRMAVADFVIILVCSFFQFLFGIYRLWEYTKQLDDHRLRDRDAHRSSVP